MRHQAWIVILTCMTTVQLGSSSELKCLSCTGVRNILDCTKLKICGQYEACYTKSTVDVNGDIFWDLGCKDIRQCSSSQLVGKRASGDTLICDQCCNTTLCQETLCGNTKSPSRGPVCYHCPDQSSLTGCNEVTTCYGHQGCDTAMAAFHQSGTDTEAGFCFNCCSGDLCNTQCSNPSGR